MDGVHRFLDNLKSRALGAERERLEELNAKEKISLMMSENKFFQALNERMCAPLQQGRDVINIAYEVPLNERIVRQNNVREFLFSRSRLQHDGSTSVVTARRLPVERVDLANNKNGEYALYVWIPKQNIVGVPINPDQVEKKVMIYSNRSMDQQQILKSGVQELVSSLENVIGQRDVLVNGTVQNFRDIALGTVTNPNEVTADAFLQSIQKVHRNGSSGVRTSADQENVSNYLSQNLTSNMHAAGIRPLTQGITVVDKRARFHNDHQDYISVSVPWAVGGASEAVATSTLYVHPNTSQIGISVAGTFVSIADFRRVPVAWDLTSIEQEILGNLQVTPAEIQTASAQLRAVGGIVRPDSTDPNQYILTPNVLAGPYRFVKLGGNVHIQAGATMYPIPHVVALLQAAQARESAESFVQNFPSLRSALEGLSFGGLPDSLVESVALNLDPTTGALQMSCLPSRMLEEVPQSPITFLLAATPRGNQITIELAGKTVATINTTTNVGGPTPQAARIITQAANRTIALTPTSPNLDSLKDLITSSKDNVQLTCRAFGYEATFFAIASGANTIAILDVDGHRVCSYDSNDQESMAAAKRDLINTIASGKIDALENALEAALQSTTVPGFEITLTNLQEVQISFVSSILDAPSPVSVPLSINWRKKRIEMPTGSVLCRFDDSGTLNGTLDTLQLLKTSNLLIDNELLGKAIRAHFDNGQRLGIYSAPSDIQWPIHRDVRPNHFIIQPERGDATFTVFAVKNGNTIDLYRDDYRTRIASLPQQS